jgi:hypothetical protein
LTHYFIHYAKQEATMITKHTLPGRRALPLLALGATLALSGGLALDAVSASAQTVNPQQQVSQNWAGYVARSSSGQSFSSVSGSWTQPAVSPSSGQGYSAFWVGIGGSGQQSQALEQIGTSADVVNGQTQYYAWYELVPAPETKLNLAIHPGDQITGKVSVNGSNVTVSLSDSTTGQSATKTVQVTSPDTSSAEWIAEAPSTTTSMSGGLQTLPLANFGKVTFTNASATAGGHTGSISDPAWNLQQVQLGPAGPVGYPGADGGLSSIGLGGSQQTPAGASPSNLSSDGSSFSVSYSTNGGAAQSSGSGTAPPTGSGAAQSTGGGYGYPGGGYGYPGGGYGYPGGGYGYSGSGYGYPSSGYGYGDPGVYVYTF